MMMIYAMVKSDAHMEGGWNSRLGYKSYRRDSLTHTLVVVTPLDFMRECVPSYLTSAPIYWVYA